MFLFDLILNYYKYSLFLFYYSHLEYLIYQNKKEKLCHIRKTFLNKKDYANHQSNLIQEKIEEIQKETIEKKIDALLQLIILILKYPKKIPLTFIKKMY